MTLKLKPVTNPALTVLRPGDVTTDWCHWSQPPLASILRSSDLSTSSSLALTTNFTQLSVYDIRTHYKSLQNYSDQHQAQLCNLINQWQ